MKTETTKNLELHAKQALIEALNCQSLQDDDMRDVLEQFDFVPRGEFDDYDIELDEEQE